MAEVGTEETRSMSSFNPVCFLFVSSYTVGPPLWNLFLTEYLTLVAWDK